MVVVAGCAGIYGAFRAVAVGADGLVQGSKITVEYGGVVCDWVFGGVRALS